MTIDTMSRPLTVDDAVALIAATAPVAGVEMLPLAEVCGRVLAEEVVAAEAVPAYDSSAMDGYAYRAADLQDTGDRQLPLQGHVAAGHPLAVALQPGHAVRILTGGALPEGADTVAIQEECTVADGHVTLPAGLVPGTNRRPAGEDMAAGSVVLTPGTRLRPQHVGVATAVGRASVLVRRRPRVSLIATGDEVRPAGEPLPPGCVHDSNRQTVAASLRALGAEVVDHGIVADRPAAVREALAAAAAGSDLVLSTGGVSVGDADHVRAAVSELGRLEFWRLPIKPGKAVAVGRVGGVPFVGLPGNPVAAMVCFWLLGRPFVLRLAGVEDVSVPRFDVVAAFGHRRKPGRREFLRCRVSPGPDGVLRAELFPRTGSGMVRALAWADGLVDISEDTGDVAPGDVVRYIPYTALDT